MNPFEKFPSFMPSLHEIDKESQESTSNSVEIMEKAYQACMLWWNNVKNMDKKQACRINPLEYTNLKW